MFIEQQNLCQIKCSFKKIHTFTSESTHGKDAYSQTKNNILHTIKNADFLSDGIIIETNINYLTPQL